MNPMGRTSADVVPKAWLRSSMPSKGREKAQPIVFSALACVLTMKRVGVAESNLQAQSSFLSPLQQEDVKMEGVKGRNVWSKCHILLHYIESIEGVFPSFRHDKQPEIFFYDSGTYWVNEWSINSLTYQKIFIFKYKSLIQRRNPSIFLFSDVTIWNSISHLRLLLYIKVMIQVAKNMRLINKYHFWGPAMWQIVYSYSMKPSRNICQYLLNHHFTDDRSEAHNNQVIKNSSTMFVSSQSPCSYHCTILT